MGGEDNYLGDIAVFIKFNGEDRIRRDIVEGAFLGVIPDLDKDFRIGKIQRQSVIACSKEVHTVAGIIRFFRRGLSIAVR